MLYKPKHLITGHKLGIKNSNLYVGVPTKYFNNEGHVGVKYNGNVRRIYLKNKVKGCGQTFNDKFSEGTYTIEYFKWRTRTDEPLEEIDIDKANKQLARLAEMARRLK